MGLLRKLFGGKKGAEEGVLSGQDDRNPSYEQQLKREFGLVHGRGGWAFEGGQIVDEMVDQFSKPHICLGVLKGFRGEAQISQVCIVVSNRMVVLVLNRKPKPICFVSGLDASGVGNLIAMYIKEGGKQEVAYRGTWLLTL